MRINHNISALNAYRNLSVNNANTAKSLERLSSGLRINKAADDAAGLAISEKMRSQIRGLEMAERNALDGISLIQTGEGALSSVHEILQRMRELSVQAANDSYTKTDRAEIQKELNQLTSEVNRIGNSTEFNTAKLLDGSRTIKFTEDGKSFPDGNVVLFNDQNQMAMTITNPDELTTGTHKIEISKIEADSVNPENITLENGPVFGASGDARSGEIGVTSEAAEDAQTLTLEKGDGVLFQDGSMIQTDNSTGLTYEITDQEKALPGDYNVEVTSVVADKYFEDGSTEYTLQPMKLTVNGLGDYSFNGGTISYDFSAPGGEPYPASETITIKYINDEEFEIFSSGDTIRSERHKFGESYQKHGLNFTLEKLGSSQSLQFDVGQSAEEIIADPLKNYTVQGTGNVEFEKPITVHSNVESGDWTITKLAAGWEVKFVDEAGVNTIIDQVPYADMYDNNHGISFQFSTATALAEGDSITFSTKAADEYLDYTVSINNQPYEIPGVKKGDSVTLSNVSEFDGLLLNADDLKEGSFSFTIDPPTPNKYLLSNADGTKTAAIEEGQPFDDYGLQFLVNAPGTLSDGESVNFSTSTPATLYQYQVSLDGGQPVDIGTKAVSGEDPFVFAFDGIPGLELNSLTGLKEGEFEFELQEGSLQDNSLKLQIGANAGQMVSLQINDMRGSALNISSDTAGEATITLLDGSFQKVWFTEIPGSTDGVSNDETLYALDVSTSEKAQAAITVLDDTIQRVSSERARLGSIQNRLEHTVDNLKIMNENVTSSESRIRDLDMALEMTNFTKNNILNQAAQAMLSQANQLPQGVLQLLK